MLSPWIHFGSISVRHIYYRVAQKHAEWQAAGLDKGKSCLDFLQQMGYREYSRLVCTEQSEVTAAENLLRLQFLQLWVVSRASQCADADLSTSGCKRPQNLGPLLSVAWLSNAQP